MLCSWLFPRLFRRVALIQFQNGSPHFDEPHEESLLSLYELGLNEFAPLNPFVERQVSNLVRRCPNAILARSWWPRSWIFWLVVKAEIVHISKIADAFYWLVFANAILPTADECLAPLKFLLNIFWFCCFINLCNAKRNYGYCRNAIIDWLWLIMISNYAAT